MAIRGGAKTKGFHDERYRALIEGLVTARKQQRISQATLAERLGLHQPFVSRFETGERRIDAVELVDIAAALGLEPHKLIEKIPPRQG